MFLFTPSNVAPIPLALPGLLYLVANLWLISAFLLGPFSRCKSALERLWWRDCLHENAESVVDIDDSDSPVTSWTWTTATSSTLETSWSFAPLFFLLTAHFLNLSSSLYLACLSWSFFNFCPPLSFSFFLCSQDRAYSRPLLSATIVPDLVPWILRKIFSLKMVKNDICLGGVSK